MARGWLHTGHRSGVWVNTVEGEGETTFHRTKDEAVASGREEAMTRRTEHVIHNLDGTIAWRHDYGARPSATSRN